jgi:hypothetical protein
MSKVAPEAAGIPYKVPMPWEWYPPLGIRTVRWRWRVLFEQSFVSLLFPLSLPVLCCVRGKRTAKSMFYWFTCGEELSTVHNFMTLGQFSLFCNASLILLGYLLHMHEVEWSLKDAYTTMLTMQVATALVSYAARRIAYGIVFSVLPADSYVRLLKGEFQTKHTLMCFASPNDPEATAHLITLGAAAQAGINIIDPVFKVRKAYFLRLRESLTPAALRVLEKILWRVSQRRPEDDASVYSIGAVPKDAFSARGAPHHQDTPAAVTLLREVSQSGGFSPNPIDFSAAPTPVATPHDCAVDVRMGMDGVAGIHQVSPTSNTSDGPGAMPSPSFRASIRTDASMGTLVEPAITIKQPAPGGDDHMEIVDMDETIDIPYYDILVLLWTEATEAAWKGISGTIVVSALMIALTIGCQLVAKALVFHYELEWSLSEAFFGKTSGAILASSVLMFQDLISLLFILSLPASLIFASNKRVTQAVAHMVRQLCSLQLVEEKRFLLPGMQQPYTHHADHTHGDPSNPWNFIDEYENTAEEDDMGLFHVNEGGDGSAARDTTARVAAFAQRQSSIGSVTEPGAPRAVSVARAKHAVHKQQSTKETMGRWLTAYSQKDTSQRLTFNDVRDSVSITTVRSKRRASLLGSDGMQSPTIAIDTPQHDPVQRTATLGQHETVVALTSVPLEATGDPPTGYFGAKFAAMPPCIRLDDAENLDAFVHCVMNTQRCFDCSLGYMMSGWVLLTFVLLGSLGASALTLTLLQSFGIVGADSSQWLGMLGPAASSTVLIAFQGVFAFFLLRENYALQEAQEKNSVFLRYHAWNTINQKKDLLYAMSGMTEQELPSPLRRASAQVSPAATASKVGRSPTRPTQLPPIVRADTEDERSSLLEKTGNPLAATEMHHPPKVRRAVSDTGSLEGARSRQSSVAQVRIAAALAAEASSRLVANQLSRHENLALLDVIAKEQELCALRVSDYCKAHPFKMFGLNPSPLAARSLIAAAGTIVVLGIRLVGMFWNTRTTF